MRDLFKDLMIFYFLIPECPSTHFKGGYLLICIVQRIWGNGFLSTFKTCTPGCCKHNETATDECDECFRLTKTFSPKVCRRDISTRLKHVDFESWFAILKWQQRLPVAFVFWLLPVCCVLQACCILAASFFSQQATGPVRGIKDSCTHYITAPPPTNIFFSFLTQRLPPMGQAAYK